MRYYLLLVLLVFLTCMPLNPSDRNKDKSENSVAMSVCTPKHSYVFYGVASEDTSVAKNVLSGVEIRVDILPFGFSYFDTTDSFGLYGIEYPCPSIPIQQQYVITATHCLGNTEQVGPILLGLCEPIHNSFNF